MFACDYVILLCVCFAYELTQSSIRSMNEIYNILAERLVPVAAAESNPNFKWVPLDFFMGKIAYAIFSAWILILMGKIVMQSSLSV